MNHPTLHHAWLLHKRPYKERSVIAEFLVQGHGRIAMVVQGARHQKSRHAANLQPFYRLLVSWRGRGELKTLVNLECDQLLFLTGERLYCGFYINELLMRSMIPGQRLDGISHRYQHALLALSGDEPLTSVLRSFELDLLSLAGYEPPLLWDCEGEPLAENGYYRFDPEDGLMPVVVHNDRIPLDVYPAPMLRALARHDYNNPDFQHSYKRFIRQAMHALIGDRPLRSRALFAKRPY